MVRDDESLTTQRRSGHKLMSAFDRDDDRCTTMVYPTIRHGSLVDGYAQTLQTMCCGMLTHANKRTNERDSENT